jgi:hypothetical protein
MVNHFWSCEFCKQRVTLGCLVVQMVKSVCENLVSCPHLTDLDLRGWSCSKYGLLSDSDK